MCVQKHVKTHTLRPRKQISSQAIIKSPTFLSKHNIQSNNSHKESLGPQIEPSLTHKICCTTSSKVHATSHYICTPDNYWSSSTWVEIDPARPQAVIFKVEVVTSKQSTTIRRLLKASQEQAYFEIYYTSSLNYCSHVWLHAVALEPGESSHRAR